MGAGRAGQPGVELVEAAACAHGGDRRRQLALGGCGVVDVVGGDALDADTVGDLGEGVVAGRVDRVAVVPQLDQHTVAPEGAHQPLELAARGRRAVVEQRRRHGTFAAPGERPHHAAGGVGDVGQRELRRPLLACQVAEADGAGEAGVAGRSVGQQHQVAAGRIGGVGIGQLAGVDLEQGVVLGAGDALGVGEAGGERELGAEHGRQAGGACRLGEAHHPVEPVVIGEGERLETEPGGLRRRAPRDARRRRGTSSWSGSAARRTAPCPARGCGWRSNGWRLRPHAGLSPPAFHDSEPGARPSRPLRPDSAASSSLQVHDGLLKPISRVSNTCSLGASRAPTRHERAWERRLASHRGGLSLDQGHGVDPVDAPLATHIRGADRARAGRRGGAADRVLPCRRPALRVVRRFGGARHPARRDVPQRERAHVLPIPPEAARAEQRVAEIGSRRSVRRPAAAVVDCARRILSDIGRSRAGSRCSPSRASTATSRPRSSRWRPARSRCPTRSCARWVCAWATRSRSTAPTCGSRSASSTRRSTRSLPSGAAIPTCSSHHPAATSARRGRWLRPRPSPRSEEPTYDEYRVVDRTAHTHRRGGVADGVRRGHRSSGRRRSRSAEVGLERNELERVVGRAVAVRTTVERNLAPVTLTGVVAGTIVLVAASVLLARDRHRELRLLAVRGMPPPRIAWHVAPRLAGAIAAGSVVGWLIAWSVISVFGPSSNLEPAALVRSVAWVRGRRRTRARARRRGGRVRRRRVR